MFAVLFLNTVKLSSAVNQINKCSLSNEHSLAACILRSVLLGDIFSFTRYNGRVYLNTFFRHIYVKLHSNIKALPTL